MENKEEQFRKIISGNKEKIVHICRYYAPTPDDQMDIYQEILMNIWRSLDSFRGKSEISTWVYRIAINIALRYAGKNYNQMKMNVDIDSPEIRNTLTGEEDDTFVREEQLQNLQTQLNQLSIIDKAIMGLVLDELSTREISDIIGITEPNVRVKIHRIKETLRETMKGGRYEYR